LISPKIYKWHTIDDFIDRNQISCVALKNRSPKQHFHIWMSVLMKSMCSCHLDCLSLRVDSSVCFRLHISFKYDCCICPHIPLLAAFFDVSLIRKVSRSATSCSLWVCWIKLRSIEVNDYNLHRFEVQHYVIWLEVSVNITLLMQLLYSLANLKQYFSNMLRVSLLFQEGSEVHLIPWKEKANMIWREVKALKMNHMLKFILLSNSWHSVLVYDIHDSVLPLEQVFVEVNLVHFVINELNCFSCLLIDFHYAVSSPINCKYL